MNHNKLNYKTDKEKYLKHSSKLYKGFLKQVRRQQEKPDFKKIKLNLAINLPKNFKGKYKHFLKVHNSKWNGMNLKNINNSLYPIKKYNGMYCKFRIDNKGKVTLSMYGKKILEKKRAKKLKN